MNDEKLNVKLESSACPFMTWFFHKKLEDMMSRGISSRTTFDLSQRIVSKAVVQMIGNAGRACQKQNLTQLMRQHSIDTIRKKIKYVNVPSWNTHTHKMKSMT